MQFCTGSLSGGWKILLSFLFFPCIILYTNAWHADLSLVTGNSNGFGGEPFEVQPVLKVIQRSEYLTDSDLCDEYTISVEVYGRSDVKVRGSNLTLPVINGSLAFYDLFINEAGFQYQLLYILKNQHNQKIAFLIGECFDVFIGDAFQLGILEQPRNEYGGRVFRQQPILAIQDRGYNIVRDVNEGTVSVSGFGSPINFIPKLFDPELDWPIQEGRVSFRRLYINKAADDHRLLFNCSLNLHGPMQIISDKFSVNIGEPAYLEILDDPSNAIVRGGRAFVRQPRIAVTDLGGNLIMGRNSEFFVVTEIYDTALNVGRMYSKHKASSDDFRAEIINGIAQFRNLAIDKIGHGYRLKYSLMRKEKEEYWYTNIYCVGSSFNVVVSDVYSIEMNQNPAMGLSNNQPFLQQPIISFVDAGGNVVESSGYTSIVASLTSSLSRFHPIVVDTKMSPVPSVLKVSFAEDFSGLNYIVLGPGEDIEIFVTFTEEIKIKKGGASDIPWIEMNTSNNETSSKAILDVSVNDRSCVLRFLYSAKLGDRVEFVNYLSEQGLHLGSWEFIDSWGRSANISLPDVNGNETLVSSARIGLDDEAPRVISIDSITLNGEYGAGHEVMLAVTFSRNVSTYGRPRLPINVESKIFVLDTVSTANEILNGSSFRLQFDRNLITRPIPWNATQAEFEDALKKLYDWNISVCIDRSLSANSPQSGGYRWALRIQTQSIDLDSFSVDSSQMKFINGTGAVVLSQLTTRDPLPDWDESKDMCTNREAEYHNGSGSNILSFLYSVLPGDSSSRLDVVENSSLVVESQLDLVYSSTYHGSVGSLLANISLGAKSLMKEKVIMIDTNPPIITNVSLYSQEGSNYSFAVGDSFLIEITFNKPVVVYGGAELHLDVGSFANNASYVSGNSSTSILFKHEVQPGQYAMDLDYHGADALVVDSSKSQHILRQSTNPITKALLTLPKPGSNHSLSATSHVLINGVRPFVESIGFAAGYEGKTYFLGDSVLVNVRFSSPVFVLGGTPALFLIVREGVERPVFYMQGNGTNILTFRYEVKLGDTSKALSYKHDSHQSLCVSNSCPVDIWNENRSEKIVQASSDPYLNALLVVPLKGGNISHGVQIGNDEQKVEIDGIDFRPTDILSIVSSNSSGLYGVGDMICFQVSFTDDVTVEGNLCFNLWLQTFSKCFPFVDGNNTSKLTFCDYVTDNDETNQLSLKSIAGTNSAFSCNGLNCLRNILGLEVLLATSQFVNLTFEMSFETSPPNIISVKSTKKRSPYCTTKSFFNLPTCRYTTGEVIHIFVKYDAPITVINQKKSQPFLLLDVGNDTATATFNPKLSDPSSLAFTYVVAHGHESVSNPLTYLCNEVNCKLGNATLIYRKATISTQIALPSLPSTSHLGVSMDDENLIFVTTQQVPNILNVTSLESGTFAPGDIVRIEVHFDEVVVVTGQPLLHLDVGRTSASAFYYSGTNSTVLYFHYHVKNKDSSLRLDYIDCYSLNLPNGSSILMASTRSTIKANLKLPYPGEEGSISHSSLIHIDNEIPYIISLTSPQAPGNYTNGDIIDIHVKFSAPIVVDGQPSLVLDTGSILRSAVYQDVISNITLIFRYRVQLGDMANCLDYWALEKQRRTSVESFQLNGGWIKRRSQNPMLHADIHLNPSLGFLDGSLTEMVSDGVVSFRNIKIGQRGSGYKVRFEPFSIHKDWNQKVLVSEIDIAPSSEYQLMSDESSREPNDHFGRSVAAYKDLVAVGIPYQRNARAEIQILTLFSDGRYVVNEMHMLIVSSDTKLALTQIWDFETFAETGVKVEGRFTLSFKTEFYTSAVLDLPCDIGPDQLATLIENARPDFSSVQVSRVPYENTGSLNSWMWSVTFVDDLLSGSSIVVDGEHLVGSGANISKSRQQKEIILLKGCFTLQDESSSRITRPIPYNASNIELKHIIEEDLELPVQRISSVNTYQDYFPELGRKWIIEYSGISKENGINMNIPNILAVNETLQGPNASVSLHVMTEGRSIMGGQFALSLNSDNFTPFIPFDSSSTTMKNALESLNEVNIATVTGPYNVTLNSIREGKRWFITFNEINNEAQYFKTKNQCASDGCNVGGLLMDTSALLGYNVGYNVHVDTGARSGDIRTEELMYVVGNSGFKSGNAMVYARRGQQWVVDARVTAHDADSNDLFGYSVDLVDSYLLIGSPGKEDAKGRQYGSAYIFERIEDFSTGIKKHFWLQRDKITPPITQKEATEFGYSVAIGKAFEKTEYVVVIGAPSANCEQGIVYVYRGQASTWRLHDTLNSDVYGGSVAGERFGAEVSLSGKTLVVGAPGHANNTGTAYVFIESYASGNLTPFVPSQKIDNNYESPGSKFGYSIDIEGNNVVICAPWTSPGMISFKSKIRAVKLKSYGACFVYLRANEENKFEMKQIVEPSNAQARDRFGIDVALGSEFLLVGQQQENNDYQCTDLMRCNNQHPARIRGKVYAFVQNSTGYWSEEAYLFPHKPQKQDMFGSPVALTNDFAFVGAPKRELMDKKSGSVSVFDLTLLKYSFEYKELQINEGESRVVNISRPFESSSSNFIVKTIDRNAERNEQSYINELFSVRTQETFPNSTTIIDSVYGTSAFGRESSEKNGNWYMWMNGMKDTRAISDYRSFALDMFMDTSDVSVSITLDVFDDNITERPNENFLVQLSSPGIIFSEQGSGTLTVYINDAQNISMESYQKLLGTDPVEGESFGTSSAIEMSTGRYLIVGSFRASTVVDGTYVHGTGAAYVYYRSDTEWKEIAKLTAGIHSKSLGRFGESVAIHQGYGRHEVTVLVGAPGQNQAFVFVGSRNTSWTMQSILQPQQKDNLESFGALNSISLSTDFAFVGSSLFECVYIFRRKFENINATWDEFDMIRSSEFDYDLYDKNNTIAHVHRQMFGISVSAFQRSFMAGAPYANYGNRGLLDVRENFDTDGVHNQGLGKGKAFIYSSDPHMQSVNMKINRNISSGSFKLYFQTHRGINMCSSSQIAFNASSLEMKESVESAPCIGQIAVTRKSYNTDMYLFVNWNLTFVDEANEIDLIQVMWNGIGCPECITFTENDYNSSDFLISTSWVQKQTKFVETDKIESSDSTTSDLFGFSVSLGSSSAIVGAPLSAARTRTTWNFETGTLVGWSAKGNAFDLQPTFGDNSLFRPSYIILNEMVEEVRGEPTSSGLKGRYYVGTYESRPSSELNYVLPHPDFVEGSHVGDGPVGTLTSDPFSILGDSIHFLIGGGCDHLKVYVELLVDGFSSMRATGQCTEKMKEEVWRVSDFIGRTGQIRIVDNGSDKWHHINVDDFRFSWEKSMGSNGGAIPSSSQRISKHHSSGKNESPKAGAAYIYDQVICYDNETDCKTWRESQRLTASDKRTGNSFGYSVSIDEAVGIAVVGSIRSETKGFYQEISTRYPYNPSSILKFPIAARYESLAKAGHTLSPTSGNMRLVNRAIHDLEKEYLVFQQNKHSGAVYVYARDGNKGINASSAWTHHEDAKITLPNPSSYDLFGSAVILHSVNLGAGSIGDDSLKTDGGSFHMFQIGWIDVKFSEVEYVVSEKETFVQVTLNRRGTSHLNSSVTVGYFTSDLTAMGIDKCSTCSEAESDPLTSHGDYVRVTGELTFDPGIDESSFEVYIVDDFCKEEHIEYIQLQLSVPGGGPIIGEYFRAQIRIDDDDWNGVVCDE